MIGLVGQFAITIHVQCLSGLVRRSLALSPVNYEVSWGDMIIEFPMCNVGENFKETLKSTET